MRSLRLLSLALLLWSCSGSDGAVGPVADGKTLEDAAAFSARLARIDLGTLGGPSSYAADVNDVSVVVGWSELPSGATHAFRWSTTQGMVDLGTLPGDESSRAVSVLQGSGGDILGMSGRDGRWQPVVWSASGRVRALSIPLAASFTTAWPTGFNARGEVVGSDFGNGERGWVWSEAAGKYDLSANLPSGGLEGNAAAVTASGVVLLTSRATTCQNNPSCYRAYTWQRASGYRALDGFDKSGETSVVGLGVSDAGSVVGWTSTEENAVTPYRWSPAGGFRRLAHYGGSSSGYGYATAIASGGVAVGADLDPASRSIVASAWLSNGDIVQLNPGNSNPSIAVAINETGTIAGWSTVAGGVNHAMIWTYSSKPSGAQLRPPVSVSAGITTASASCLGSARSIASRRALFDCAITADRGRSHPLTAR